MNKLSLIFVTVALLLGASARHASAEERVDATKLLTAVVALAADVGFTAADVAAAVEGEWRSRVYGGVEAAAGAAQMALFVYWGSKEPATDSTARAESMIALAWVGTLAVHGVVTLLVPREATEPPPPPRPLTVAPVALPLPARPPAPGLALLGRF